MITVVEPEAVGVGVEVEAADGATQTPVRTTKEQEAGALVPTAVVKILDGVITVVVVVAEAVVDGNLDLLF